MDLVSRAKEELLEFRARKDERRRREEAERQAFWDEYKQQLDKSVPYQPGSSNHHARRIRGRYFNWQ